MCFNGPLCGLVQVSWVVRDSQGEEEDEDGEREGLVQTSKEKAGSQYAV